jgi:hypothetical protein
MEPETEAGRAGTSANAATKMSETTATIGVKQREDTWVAKGNGTTPESAEREPDVATGKTSSKLEKWRREVPGEETAKPAKGKTEEPKEESKDMGEAEATRPEEPSEEPKEEPEEQTKEEDDELTKRAPTEMGRGAKSKATGAERAMGAFRTRPKRMEGGAIFRRRLGSFGREVSDKGGGEAKGTRKEEAVEGGRMSMPSMAPRADGHSTTCSS